MSNVQWLLMQIIISEVRLRNTMYFCSQGAIVTLCTCVLHDLREALLFPMLTSHFCHIKDESS